MTSVVEKSPSKTMGLQAPESKQPQADFSSIGDKVRGHHILCQLQGLRVLIFCLLCVFQTALVSPTSEQFDLLLRQLRERLDDGRGETIYEIGIGLGKHISLMHFLHSLKNRRWLAFTLMMAN
jgi:hypothetical protein